MSSADEPLSEHAYRDAQIALKKLPKGISLLEATQYYIANHRRAIEGVPLRDAVEEFLKDKEAQGLREYSIKSVGWLVRRLARDMGDDRIADISGAILQNWLKDSGFEGRTWNNYVRAFRDFFGWCVRRHYAAHDISADLSPVRVDQALPGILTVAEAQALLAAAEERQPEICGYLALGLFAGIRPTELQRLSWASIGPEHIHIGPGAAKTRQQRYVSISANLAAWIGAYRADGPVAVPNLRERVEAARSAAGLTHWPHDALRHSFATYHLALHHDAPRTSYELGHRSPNMLYESYRALATETDGQTYFAIRPRACAETPPE